MFHTENEFVMLRLHQVVVVWLTGCGKMGGHGVTFQATVEKTGWTWSDAGRREFTNLKAVTAVTAVPDFKTVKKICHGSHGTYKKPNRP